MKIILFAAAAAFSFVTPVAAQPAQSHQGHQQSSEDAAHQGHGSGGQHQGHGAPAQHGGGQDHSKHANCCADANGNGKMDCCEGSKAAQRPCCAGHAQHQQHGQQAAPAQLKAQ